MDRSQNALSVVWRRWTCAAIVTLALLADYPVRSLSQTAAGEAWISGSISECWEGRRIPVANLRVYVLIEDESPKIRDDIKKLENPPRNGNTVDVQVFYRLYDQLVEDLKLLGDARSLVRTDKEGRFSVRPLRINQRYLVLAIDWDKGDMDEMAYYRYKLVDVANPGGQNVQLYMGPGEEAACKGK